MASVLQPLPIRACVAVRACTSRRARITATRSPGSVRRNVAPTAVKRASVIFSRASDVIVRSAAKRVACETENSTVTDKPNVPNVSVTLVVTAALVQLATVLPSLAVEIDSDGVQAPNILTTIGFTIAVALLAVITLGVLYLSAREALDKAEEQNAREEDERAERVIKANKGRVPGMGPSGGKKQKKKKSTPLAQAGDLGPNRRERRRMEREEEE